MDKELDNVLVISPVYGYVEAGTQLAIDECASLGATVIKSVGCSDIAQHRCLLASMAERSLLTARNGHLQTVLWLDSDQIFRASDVVILRSWLQAASEGSGLVSVSGAYCAKQSPEQFAARRLAPQEPDRLVELSETVRVNLPPVLCGMGFLLQWREVFLAHCAESRRVTVRQKLGGELMIPVVTASGAAPMADELQWHRFDHPGLRRPRPGEQILVRRATGYLQEGEPLRVEWSEASDMARMSDQESGDRWIEWRPVEPDWGWSSEDFTYCQWEWSHGRPVYLAPVPIGHRMMTTAMPTADTVLKGVRDTRFGALIEQAREAR